MQQYQYIYLHVYAIISSIVVQEMQHMALAANVLNAIGGKPRLTDRKFVPKFPGQGLPNGVRPDLKYSLGPLTRDRIANLFMEIEHPSESVGNILHDALCDQDGEPINLDELTDNQKQVARIFLRLMNNTTVPLVNFIIKLKKN